MLYFARWKIVVILAICALGLIYASPNFWRSDNLGTNLPSWIPHKTVNLGLDLQGGAHLLIEVQTSAVLKERLEAVEDNVRRSLRDARIGYRGLGVRSNAVVFTLRDPGDADRARQLVAERDGLVTVEIDDAGSARLEYPPETVVDVESAAVEQTLEILRIRLNELGLREPTIQRHGADRIIVQLPGVDDPDAIKELLTQTAKLTFHLLDQRNANPTAAAPPGARWLKGTDPLGQVIDYLVEKRVRVSGERLVDAQQTFQDGQPVVSFRFDSVGARLFGRTTGEHVGRPLAIVLDNEVISAPRINEPILGGSGIISGSFSLTEAQNLALLLRAGALPAPLVYLEERTVGPGLGQDSIDAGKAASIIGMVAVLVFMVAVYGLFGVMANVALLFNMALIFGALSLLQATLTLPGIAGIVLTIGMAVDANVLIFERIREEARVGRGVIGAIDAGYDRALKTIIDANLTTLIAAALLFWFGSGPVKGFAVTLAIGIMTSMFTAIWVTRLMVVFWVRRRRPQLLPI